MKILTQHSLRHLPPLRARIPRVPPGAGGEPQNSTLAYAGLELVDNGRRITSKDEPALWPEYSIDNARPASDGAQSRSRSQKGANGYIGNLGQPELLRIAQLYGAP